MSSTPTTSATSEFVSSCLFFCFACCRAISGLITCGRIYFVSLRAAGGRGDRSAMKNQALPLVLRSEVYPHVKVECGEFERVTFFYFFLGPFGLSLLLLVRIANEGMTRCLGSPPDWVTRLQTIRLLFLFTATSQQLQRRTIGPS